MRAHSAFEQPNPNVILALVISIGLLALSACGTLELGIEQTATPTAPIGTATPTLIPGKEQVATLVLPSATPTSTVPPTAGGSTPTSEPTPTAIPSSPVLRMAFVKDGNVWLWTEGQGARALTAAGDVVDVRISDDGEIAAFTRNGELWMVRSNGTDERLLVTATELRKIESRDPFDYPVLLNRFEWLPGSHVLAYNTRLRMEIGLILNDDLRLVHADTLQQIVLRSPGEGGEFYCAPNGRQIAVVTSGTIGLIGVDGHDWRILFTYTPPVTQSEVQYYARPVWAADSGSLYVAIPPVAPFAQPTQPTSVWRLNTDGTPAWLVESITAAPHSPFLFSPNLRHIAYLAGVEDASPGGEQMLVVMDLDGGDTTPLVQAHNIYDWSPDSRHIAFASNTQVPQVWIADLESTSAVPANDEPNTVSLDVRWIDANRYLFLAQNAQGWDIVLGEIGRPSAILASVTGRQPAFDFSPVTEP